MDDKNETTLLVASKIVLLVNSNYVSARYLHEDLRALDVQYLSYHRNIKLQRKERMSRLDFHEVYQYRSLESDRHIRLLRLCKR